ncbi:MAG: hypothetical protein K2M56_01265 [Muribaculaceae bacterium]|nr:hypothetical protein [Muribaculaceae bacterium]
MKKQKRVAEPTARFGLRHPELLEAASRHWLAMGQFRTDRERCKRYCYGRQWDDVIEVDGERMKEEDYIRSQGNVPLKNNLIRRLVRSVLGVFRNQYSYPEAEKLELLSSDPDQKLLYGRLLLNAERNRLEELHARTMEEFLISGLAVHRKSLAPPPEGAGGMPAVLSLTSYVTPDSFFLDSATRDIRGWDARVVGQIHDVDFPTLCASLARGPEDVVALRGIYGEATGQSGETGLFRSCYGMPSGGGAFGGEDISAMRDFYRPSAPGLCRVIEIWTRESTERYRIHDRRSGELYKIESADYDQFRTLHEEEIAAGQITLQWIVDDVWRYHYLSPSGHVLAEGISPIPGGGQPYVWKAYPFIDGEIHSFVADVIDQQRHTNRLITLYDWVIRSSAKGVLLFPESALPDDVEIDDISDEWSRFNGVILFRPKAGMPLPQQVSGGASQAGITDLLNIQLKMLEDVSGVNGALEGKINSGSVSGTLYNQQTRQAMTALLDILESYNAFILEGARLDLRIIG